MYQNLINEYLNLYNIYKGTMTKESKIRLYKLIKIEINILENNRTDINDTKKQNLMQYVWAFIAAVLSIGTFFNDVFTDETSKNYYGIILFIIMGVCVICAIYKLNNITKNIENNKLIRLEENIRIKEMYITQQVLSDLLLEEDSYTI